MMGKVNFSNKFIRDVVAQITERVYRAQRRYAISKEPYFVPALFNWTIAWHAHADILAPLWAVLDRPLIPLSANSLPR